MFVCMDCDMPYASKEELDAHRKWIHNPNDFGTGVKDQTDATFQPASDPLLCGHILETALALSSGERAKQHGDKRQNHANIAALWNAYLGWRLTPECTLTAKDVALMMALLKIARTKLGTSNPDDYIDGAAYIAIAGELA